jgi:hypothetical protein
MAPGGRQKIADPGKPQGEPEADLAALERSSGRQAEQLLDAG